MESGLKFSQHPSKGFVIFYIPLRVELCPGKQKGGYKSSLRKEMMSEKNIAV